MTRQVTRTALVHTTSLVFPTLVLCITESKDCLYRKVLQVNVEVQSTYLRQRCPKSAEQNTGRQNPVERDSKLHTRVYRTETKTNLTCFSVSSLPLSRRQGRRNGRRRDIGSINSTEYWHLRIRVLSPNKILRSLDFRFF